MNINWLDIISTIVVLLALFLINKHYKWWILYCLGCLLWAILKFQAQYYGGIVMELTALVLGIRNYFIYKKKYYD